MLPPNLVVSACAGSGKTHEIIQRLLALLMSDIPPGEILAITYTKKAAAEIKTRLLDSLQAKADDGDQTASRVLRRILFAPTATDGLQVYTFHSWFGVLLAGKNWSPGWFGPAQVMESEVAIFDDAWLRWLQKSEVLASPKLKLVLTYISPTKVKESLQGFINQLNAWRLYPEGKKTTATGEDEAITARRHLTAALEKLIGGANGDGQDFKNVVHATNIFFADNNDLGTLKKAFLTAKDEVRVRLQNNADKNDYTGLLENAVAALLAAVTADEEVHMCRFNNAMITLAVSFEKELEATKQAAHQMSFNDMEYEVFHAITESGDTGAFLYRLCQRFKHLLIDEFQDTNPMQWAIIRRWLHAAHGSDTAPSVFIVGDEKQAIYRFRHGDARLLGVAKEFLEEYYCAEKIDKNICRRLAPPVLQLVNAVFNGKIDGFNEHNCAAGVNDSLPGRVEWHPPPPASRTKRRRRRMRNPLIEARTDEENKRQAWANAIAGRVTEILGHWEIHAGGGVRLCRTEDILILLPQTRHAEILLDALGRRGIPCSRQGGGTSFLQSFACRDILALAAVLLSPDNSLALAQTLKSPIFSLADETLAALADGDLWHNLLHSEHTDTRRARACLKRWREWSISGKMPAHDLLMKIFTDGELPARFLATVSPPYRRQVDADLSALLDFSLQKQGGRAPLLRQLLDNVRAEITERKNTGIADPTGVRLMTVHSAKGLEAPVVILAETSFDVKGTREKSISVDLLVDWPPAEAAPTAFVFRPRTFKYAGRTLMEERNTLREREYENQFYVAMTRAKQALLIFSAQEANNPRAERLAQTVEKIGVQENGIIIIGDDLSGGQQPQTPPDIQPAATPPAAIGTRQSSAFALRGQTLHQLIALKLSDFNDDEALKLAAPAATGTALQEVNTLLADTALRRLLDGCVRFEVETEYLRDGQIARIDLLIFTADEIWIIDHKTGGGDLARYHPQLAAYRQLIQEAYPGSEVRAAFLTANGLETLAVN